MDDYLTKPLQVAALAQALERWTVPAAAGGNAAPAASAAASESSAEPQLIDFARLEEFREFDDAALTMTHQVMALFLADTPPRLQAIADALAAQDAPALAAAAHALKGSAGNVGAVALQREAGALESRARGGVPDDAPQRLQDVARTLGGNPSRAGRVGLKRLSVATSLLAVPYFAVKLALAMVLALIMKPASAAVASAGMSSLSVLSAWTVKM